VEESVLGRDDRSAVKKAPNFPYLLKNSLSSNTFRMEGMKLGDSTAGERTECSPWMWPSHIYAGSGSRVDTQSERRVNGDRSSILS
jgi:hypothetical protein